MYLLIVLLVNSGLIVEIEQVLGCPNVVRLILLLESVAIHSGKTASLLHESLQVAVEEHVLELCRLVRVLLALHVEVNDVLKKTKDLVAALARRHDLHQVLHLVHACIKACGDDVSGYLTSPL